jgi:hypothetical protein
MKLQVGAGWFRPRRLVGVAAGALALLVWSSTTPTLSAWTAAVVGNPTGTAAAASLAFAHSAGACSMGPRVTGSTACSGSVLPAGASTSGTVTGTDSITDNGTAIAASLSASVSAASCAPVKLDNTKAAGDVMLPRYTPTFRAADPFGGTNAITLDGSSYAAAVTPDQQRSVNGQTYAVGVWFKAADGQQGPLFSIDTSPVNASTSNGDDRTVYLGADGKLNFVYSATGQKLTSGSAYDDDTWHFVYVTLADTVAGTTVQMSADTRTPVSATNLLTSFTTVNGYWHLGWGSTALMGSGTSAFFAGSLSNLVVFNSGSAPAQPTAAQLASQSAFSTWAGSATDAWLLGDSGTTTYTGSNPVIGSTSPCTYLNVVWSFTNPAATAVTSRTLAAFATGTAFPVGAAPGPGGTQTSSVAITRASGYVGYVSGLRLLVPVTYKVQAGAWALTFSWASSDSVVLG